MRRRFVHAKLDRHLFALGWKRLGTKTIVMDSVMLGPLEVTLYRFTTEGRRLIAEQGREQ